MRRFRCDYPEVCGVSYHTAQENCIGLQSRLGNTSPQAGSRSGLPSYDDDLDAALDGAWEDINGRIVPLRFAYDTEHNTDEGFAASALSYADAENVRMRAFKEVAVRSPVGMSLTPTARRDLSDAIHNILTNPNAKGAWNYDYGDDMVAEVVGYIRDNPDLFANKVGEQVSLAMKTRGAIYYDDGPGNLSEYTIRGCCVYAANEAYCDAQDGWINNQRGSANAGDFGEKGDPNPVEVLSPMGRIMQRDDSANFDNYEFYELRVQLPSSVTDKLSDDERERVNEMIRYAARAHHRGENLGGDSNGRIFSLSHDSTKANTSSFHGDDFKASLLTYLDEGGPKAKTDRVRPKGTRPFEGLGAKLSADDIAVYYD